MSGLSRLVLLTPARKRLLLIPIALLATACATTPPTGPVTPAEPAAPPPAQAAAPVSAAEARALQELVSLQDRLYRVAAPLLVKNAELCNKNARNLLGFTAKNKYSYSTDFINASQSLLGLGERLQVMGVLAGSGAERAGVRRSDILVAVDGTALPQGENAERDAAAILAPLVTSRTKVRLNVARGDNQTTLEVPLTYACAFGIELGNTDNVVAYADGHRILIARGMMNAARTDEELAYVMAKEMAHNVLAHAERLRMSATVGGIIDNLTRMHPDMSTMVGLSGVKPMPQNLDAMADKLSLYMLARAGYGIDNAVAFWRRLASQYPATVLNGYVAMHPATAYRITMMERTVKEIKTKQATKRPLLP